MCVVGFALTYAPDTLANCGARLEGHALDLKLLESKRLDADSPNLKQKQNIDKRRSRLQ